MTQQEVVHALALYRDSAAKNKNFIELHWAAKKAMAAGLAAIPPDLMEAYYDKNLSVWPEVPPQLEEHHEEALQAYGRVAPGYPEASYAAILACYGEIRRAFHWLRNAHSAMASRRGGTDEERQAIREAAADPALIRCLQASWERFEAPMLHSRRPSGWAAILLHEGSPTSVALLKPYETIDWEDQPYEYNRQDLYFLRPEQPTPAAQELIGKLQALLAERDARTGQNEWFSALGLGDGPNLFRLQFLVPTAKGGQELRLEMSREWRSSAVYWYAAFGKARPIFTTRTGRVETNKRDLPPLTLAGIPEWMRERGAWKWDQLEILEEGFEPPIRPRLLHWLQA